MVQADDGGRVLEDQLVAVDDFFEELAGAVDVVGVCDAEDEVDPARRVGRDIGDDVAPDLAVGDDDRLVVEVLIDVETKFIESTVPLIPAADTTSPTS